MSACKALRTDNVSQYRVREGPVPAHRSPRGLPQGVGEAVGVATPFNYCDFTLISEYGCGRSIIALLCLLVSRPYQPYTNIIRLTYMPESRVSELSDRKGAVDYTRQFPSKR